MQALPRSQRIAVAGWMILAAALWNGIFEMIVVRGVKEYLFRAALYEAGRRPFTAVADVMDPEIFHATWVASLWSSIVLLAALITIRSVNGSSGLNGQAAAASGPRGSSREP